MTISVTAAGGLSLAQMAQAALDTSQGQGTAGAGKPQDAPLAIRAVDPEAMQAAMTKQLSMVGDLSTKLTGVTDQLATSMREILAKRPDLADAQFDFMTDNGRIKVVSKTMTESDRAWVESTLNANAGLVLATRDFHQQAVDLDAQGAAVRGETFTESDRAAAGQRADTRFQFMSLINAAVARNGKSVEAGGHFTTLSGTPLKVEQSAGSARGTLALLDTARQLSSGAAVFVDGTGQKTYGRQAQLIDVGFDVLARYTPDDGNSVGFHEIA
ncbi:hypothetical protein BBJ41_25760 [Burkholderia stabilis]|uniref:hypothetical protein n=1 Tax=Burkholderia stabilis TaxID=95485 RepID=UPI000851E6F0|nr:hypothetical protein [Burkholderia stabilis]AOR70917.1 hypothetical protein BBJ41_25760 [Burkholderia stabilis]HDR9489890.1 hypothetical protein [Burkholderia stabilis]HDR9520985.1 hypothetical protein [Burkholderia stabilis]HDR9528736.1 hypothetical protein [Burkholderia stabilis]HDR9536732.1 hypothetical protein [Burkholderia stabilis]